LDDPEIFLVALAWWVTSICRILRSKKSGLSSLAIIAFLWSAVNVELTYVTSMAGYTKNGCGKIL
jgi:hypothetical protein